MKPIFSLAIVLVFAVGSAVQAQTEAPVRVLDQRPLELTAYELTWDTDRSLDADATIGVVFPSLCNLSQVVMADSKKLNGGLSVAVSGDTVWVERSGRGDAVATGERVDLKIASIFNPPLTDSSFEFKLVLRDRLKPVLMQTLQAEILTRK